MTHENLKQSISEKSEKDTQISQIKCRRTKERKIGHIIEKVSEWRKLYNGDLLDNKGK